MYRYTGLTDLPVMVNEACIHSGTARADLSVQFFRELEELIKALFTAHSVTSGYYYRRTFEVMLGSLNVAVDNLYDEVCRVSVQTATVNNMEGRKYADFLHLPHHLEGFFDYEDALAYAKEVNKPVFIDFTGHACVNCREMEERVLADQRILERLRNDFVIVALYMDDKTVLDESEWVTTESGKVFKSLGKINSHIANDRYGINAQPYYLIVDLEGNELVPNRSYDLDIDAFVEFLDNGKKAFYDKQ